MRILYCKSNNVARIGFASRLASSARASHRLVARSADLAHSAVRFSPPRHNDASLKGHLDLFANHCAGSENRVLQTLYRFRMTKPLQRLSHMLNLFDSRTQSRRRLVTRHKYSLRSFCAGSENRTRVSTLGRSHSTTKPCPLFLLGLLGLT